MRKYLTVIILFCAVTSYAQDSIKPIPIGFKHMKSIDSIKPRFGFDLAIGNAAKAGVFFKNVEVEGLRILSTKSSYPFIIGNINYHYSFLYAGYGTEGLSYGVRAEYKCFTLRIGMAGKYGVVNLGITNLKQKKIFTNNDIILMGLQFIAGAADGIREQVLFHPNELFLQNPHLNRDWYDSRISWQNKSHYPDLLISFSDAAHFYKMIYTYCDVASFCVTAADFSEIKKLKTTKQKIFFVGKKLVEGLGFRKAGFYTVYNVYFHNK